MVVPEGYKQTEVGLIPKHWEVKEFGEICSPSKQKFNPLITSNRPCIELEDLSQETGRLINISDSKTKVSLKTFFSKGQVLFGKLRPYLRKYYYTEFEGVCSSEIWALVPNKEIYPRFVFYQVQSTRIIDAANVSTGTKMPRAEWKTVSETKIPLPPLPEQAAIAEALSDMDALIAQTEKLIEKKKAIKQGVMQELLKPKEGWERSCLFELADGQKKLFDDGDWIESEFIIEKGIRLIQTGNIGIGKFVDKNSKKYISEESFVKLNCKELHEGDLLICRLAEPAGRACVMPNIGEYKVITSVDVSIFRGNKKKVNRELLSQIFSSKDWFQKVLEKVGGTTHKRISRGALGKIEFQLPPIEEQNRVAEILMEMDSEISFLDLKLQKLKLQKQGMMQALLTGKIRLI